ncbi:hypothetical protein RJ639_002642 [Escallonia herrerae]|uniref:Uncharacterized protein n=1 Tax=Escallonia herrerae TaxID=1293975 RepID=A0AA88XRM2_9ASTE|nr:hypothetical protein RJ639_002642 [Escallonia herrerae]
MTPHQEIDSQITNPNSTQIEQSRPHSPQTASQTLETLITQNPDHQTSAPTPQQQEEEQEHEQEPEPEQEQNPQVLDQVEEQDPEEQSGMTLSPPASTAQPMTGLHVTLPDHTHAPPLTSPTNPHRRPNKRKPKKGARNTKKLQAIDKKVQTLIEKLNPIPFVPSKALDFSKHEALLRRLGLWDFVHIEFNRTVRVDLIAQLVASYDQKSRCSYVNDFRINVNRADLARALKLPPVKKEKGSAMEGVDLDWEPFSDESTAFLEDFVSNWVLLHEDTWMMPGEVMNWTLAVKDGHPEKVDWSSLFWIMVEKELMQGEKLGDCYYASHLQYLIKFQREAVLREEPKMELVLEVKEGEEDGAGDVKMGGANEFVAHDNVIMDEANIELTLGQDVVEKDEVKHDAEMDVAACKEEEEHGRWLMDGKQLSGEHFLLPCRDQTEGSKQEDEEVDEENEEDEEEEAGFGIGLNGHTLSGDGLTGNLLHGMETAHIPFNLQGQFNDQPSVELLTSTAETRTTFGGSFMFTNGVKRDLGHEHDISNHSLNGSNKRLRIDGPWDHKSDDIGSCLEVAHNMLEKARMMHEAKEGAYQDLSMNQQYLLNELQRRDAVIDHMNKTKCEEQQKKNGEIFRLERELYVMGNLIEGYRKALKESHKVIHDQRQRCTCQPPEEPLYKDAGPGGLVLSTTELEKQREKQEEEERLNRFVAEQMFEDATKMYIGKLELHLNKITLLDEKLVHLENEVKLLHESSAKGKVSEIPAIDAVLQSLPSDVTDIYRAVIGSSDVIDRADKGCDVIFLLFLLHEELISNGISLVTQPSFGCFGSGIY